MLWEAAVSLSCYKYDSVESRRASEKLRSSEAMKSSEKRREDEKVRRDEGERERELSDGNARLFGGRERDVERAAILCENHRSLGDEPATEVECLRGLKILRGVGDLADP
jgi:hypothetical protein